MQSSKFFNAAGERRPPGLYVSSTRTCRTAVPAAPTALRDSNPMSRLAGRIVCGHMRVAWDGSRCEQDVPSRMRLYTDHRMRCDVPVVGDVVEVLREFDVENQI